MEEKLINDEDRALLERAAMAQGVENARLAAVARSVLALEGAVAPVTVNLDPEVGIQLGSLADGVAELLGRVARLEKAADAPVTVLPLEELEARVARLDSAAEKGGQNREKILEQLVQLGERVAKLEEASGKRARR